MRLTVIRRAAALVCASMLPMAFSGCGNAPTKAVVAAPRAPVQPEEVKPGTIPDVKFVNITKEAGIQFRHFNGAFGEKLLPETMGAGVAFLDYDGDGDQDLFFVNSSYWPGHEVKPAPTQALYRNDGKGHFEDVTQGRRSRQDLLRPGRGRGRLRQRRRPGPLRHGGRRRPPVPQRRQGALRRRHRVGQRARAQRLAQRRGVPRHRERRRPRPVRGQLHHLVARDRQGAGLPAHRTRVGRTGRRPPSAGRSARSCATTAATSSISATPRASRCGRPTCSVPIGKSLGVAPYDVDGDGLVDIAVANDTVQNFLFHNKGGGKFEEVGDPLRRGVRPVGLAPRRHGHRLGTASSTTSASAWRSATSPTR